MRGLAGIALPLAAFAVLPGCSREARLMDADQPVTAPVSALDPRRHQFESNLFQIAQGGQYFTWFGCGGCHGADARGVANLSDGIWKNGNGIDRLYGAIAAHGSLGARIPVEQRWQLAAYVKKLPELDPALRRRQDADQSAEPEGDGWKGPLR